MVQRTYGRYTVTSMNDRKRWAVACMAGSFKGIFVHGVLHGLEAAGFRADAYAAAGLGDVTLIAYPGGRHEVFNEINRAEVTADLVSWLDAHLAQGPRTLD